MVYFICIDGKPSIRTEREPIIMSIKAILRDATKLDASDLHLAAGLPPIYRQHGILKPLDGYEALLPIEIEKIAFSMITEGQKEKFKREKELDFSFEAEEVGRFRINMFLQKGTISLVFRTITGTILTPEALELPPSVINLTNLKNGLVLVTGPSGSGKSTMLASLINKINREQNKHILTIEDPIEFVYKHHGSMISQRQVGTDTNSFKNALKSALREDPDVILIGEMRDLETVSATLSIAETGHLVFATLHTIDVAQTVDRIIDIFPANQQQQIRVILGSVLRGVICQQLLPRADGRGRIAAREILIPNIAIGNMIREGHTQQIYSFIQGGRDKGMITLDASIEQLFHAGEITKETAEAYLVHLQKPSDPQGEVKMKYH